jgi:hypothetical protein
MRDDSSTNQLSFYAEVSPMPSTWIKKVGWAVLCVVIVIIAAAWVGVMVVDSGPAAARPAEAYDGVQIVGDGTRPGYVVVEFFPSPHSTPNLKSGDNVFISQTLRPTIKGAAHTPVWASSSFLVRYADAGKSPSSLPAQVAIPRRSLDAVIEADRNGALEIHLGR